MTDDAERKTLFSGEVQFAGYSDSHTQGPKITFRLPDSDDLEAFRALTVAKGNQSGQRVMMALVLIGDDEQPLPPPEPTKHHVAPARRAGRTVGPYCMEAIELCRNERFRAWASSECGITIDSEDRAKQFICDACGIASRTELDVDEEAKEAFIREIRVPFMRSTPIAP